MAGVLEAFVRYVQSPGAARSRRPGSFGCQRRSGSSQGLGRDHRGVERTRFRGSPRVHLAAVPTVNPIDNALVINALQRHAAVVVQKSLAEGFGLTVAEAMWKSRPVVASRVGGIVDQIIHNQTGLLVDPHDLESLGAAVERLLRDPADATRLARNAHSHVVQEFLGDRHLLQYADLLTELIGTT